MRSYSTILSSFRAVASWGLYVLLFVVAACRRDVVYMHYEAVDAGGWDKTEEVGFRVDSIPAESRYALALHLRTLPARNYPYRAIDVEVRQRWTLPESVPPQPESAAEYRTSLARRRAKARLAPAPCREKLIAERTDTLRVVFMTTEGDALGQGMSIVGYSVPLASVSLPQGARGHFRVRHVMRREVLPGIADVGIAIRRQ